MENGYFLINDRFLHHRSAQNIQEGKLKVRASIPCVGESAMTRIHPYFVADNQQIRRSNAS
jgi:hypothetical protein